MKSKIILCIIAIHLAGCSQATTDVPESALQPAGSSAGSNLSSSGAVTKSMPGQSSSSIRYVTYRNQKYGYGFEYPASWPKPTLADGGPVELTDSGVPSAFSDWQLNMSPCLGCAEGGDTYSFNIQGMSAVIANRLVSNFRNHDLVENIQESSVVSGAVDVRFIEFYSGGMCGDRMAYWIGKNYALAFTGRCAADIPVFSQTFDHIVDSFSFTSAFNASH